MTKDWKALEAAGAQQLQQQREEESKLYAKQRAEDNSRSEERTKSTQPERMESRDKAPPFPNDIKKSLSSVRRKGILFLL